MAITIVGTVQAGNAIDGGNVVLTFDGTLAEGDMALVVGTVGTGGGAGGEIAPPTGYTEIAEQDTGAEVYSGGVWRKFMGATPDTDVTVVGTGIGQDATTAVSIMLRGVDPSTPLDIAVVKTGPTTGADPDLTGGTTVTDGAWAVLALVSASSDADVGAPTGYANKAHVLGVDTNRAAATVTTKEIIAAGAEDPGAFIGFASTDWTGWFIVIRPASFPVTSLLATGTGSILDVVDEIDTAVDLHLSVDDDPDTPTDSDWINNAV